MTPIPKSHRRTAIDLAGSSKSSTTKTAVHSLAAIFLAVTLLLFALPAAAQCNPSIEDCAGTPTSGPDVGMTPDGGTWTVDSASVTVPVTIYMTDADGLNAATRDARLWNGGSNVPVNLVWTTNADGTNGSLKGDLQLTSAGDNVLVVQIADRLGNVGRASATFRMNVAEPGLPVVNWDVHHNEYRNMGLGAFVLGYPGASYTSMGVTRSAGLIYNSEQARPTAFVQVDARPDGATASEFVTMSLRIEQWSSGATGTQPLVGKESFYTKGDGTFQRLAVHWTYGETAPTGVYKYWAVVRSYRADGSFKERRNMVRVLVVNEKTSRYGAGWSVAGVQRLHVTADGLLLNEGNGVARFFKGACTAACTYETPAGDFTVLTYRPDSATWARTYPDGLQVVFNQAGLMTSAADRFGNTTTYEWQSSGGTQPVQVLTRIVDPVGHASTFAYNTSGYLRSITTAGRTLTCAYNTANQLTSISGQPNLQIAYNTIQQIVAYTRDYSTATHNDPGATSNLTYDEFRQLRTYKAPFVMASGTLQQPKTTYRSMPWRTAPSPSVTNSLASPAAAVQGDAASVLVIDPRGHTTTIVMERYGNPIRVVDVQGITTNMTWTADGLPESVSAPSHYSGYTWNQKGQPLVQTAGGSLVYMASYNAQNLPEFVASGGAALWYAYGPRGEVVRSWPGKKEDEQRTATTYEYNPRYQVVRTIGPKGEKAEWSYDGNVWRNVDYARVTREDGIVLTTSHTYDALSRERTVTSPLNHTITFEFDNLDRPTRMIDPDGRSTWYQYTGPHLTKVIDPANRTFEFSFNALGWLESERFPGDQTSRTYTYNADGLILSVTDRRGQTVTYAYDASHRLTDRTADGLTTTFRHPDLSTIVVSNHESVVTTGLGQGASKLGHVSSTLAGRRFEIKRALDMNDAWRDIGFDLNTYVNGSLQKTDRVRYHADFKPSDATLSGTYQIEDMSGRRTTMAFDTSGRPVRTAYPNGVTGYNWFTSEGRQYATTFDSPAVNRKLGATFSHDAFGRLSTRTSKPEDRRWAYGYDSSGQLAQYSVHQPSGIGGCDPTVEQCPPVDWFPILMEEYGYDASGNRTDRGAVVAGGTNRYSSFDGYTLEYDAEGNLTRKYKSGVIDQSYTWDSLGQLTSVTTNGSTVSYGYDGNGLRVRRTENGQSRFYVYDGDDLLLETDHNGNALRMYTHWPGVDTPHSVRVTSFGQDFVYYYTSEAPGHVTGLMDVFGNVAGEHHYKPFGEVESSTDDAGQPLRFMGRELDFSTGLYYVRSRWYDPTLARFVSPDPIGLAGGMNPYSYAGNDPVNARDPSGLGPEPQPGCGQILPQCHPLWDEFFWMPLGQRYMVYADGRESQRNPFDFGTGERAVPRVLSEEEQFFADLAGKTSWLNEYVMFNVKTYAAILPFMRGASGTATALRGRLVLNIRGTTVIGHMKDVAAYAGAGRVTKGGWAGWDSWGTVRRVAVEVKFIRDAMSRGDAIRLISPGGGGQWTQLEKAIARYFGAPVF